MLGDTVSSGSSGRRQTIRTLSSPPSNSTFTMSSRSSSFSKENEPPAIALPKRHQLSSRFNGPVKPKVVSDTSSLPAGLAMLRERAEREETYSINATETQQSTFDIPPVPGFSDLINGTYEDGTPVFSNQTKPSRFSSSRFQRAAGQQVDSRLSHRSDVEAVSVPESEQAIVLSIKVLQDKVNQLENARTKREIHVLELEQKVRDLEYDNSLLRRRSMSDSAVGLSDEDSDDTQSSGMAERTLTVQKNRLENSLRAVTRQVEEANKKVSISETTMKAVAEERDRAVHQLGLAYVQQEQLKYQNNRLEQQKQSLATDVEDFYQQVVRLKELAIREAQKDSPVGRDANEYLFGNKAADATSPKPSAEAQKKDSAVPRESTSPLEAQKNLGRGVHGSRSIEGSQPKIPSSKGSATLDSPRGVSEDTTPILRTRRLFPRTNGEEDTQSTNVTMPKEPEVANLRSKIEHQRVVRERVSPPKRSYSASFAEKARAAPSMIGSGKEHKPLDAICTRNTEARNAKAKAGDSPATNETKYLTTKNLTRHCRSASDPISYHLKPPESVESDGFDFDKAFRDMDADDTKSSKSSKSEDTLTKPILKPSNWKAEPGVVRKRVSFDSDEPTVRPSSPPDQVLAEQIESLHKELERLNLKRDVAQKTYDDLNPALARRQHNIARQDVEALVKDIDGKREQIYHCYDILEDRKQSGVFVEDDFDRGCRLH